MRRHRASLCWAFALALAAGAAKGAPVTGGLIADPDHPARLRHHNGGPAFIASVGEPEGFLYRGTRRADGTRSGDQAAIITELKARGLNALYAIGFADSRYGGDGPADANPFVGANVSGEIDADVLNQWYGWFQSLDAAGVITYFCFYDDLIDVLPGKRTNWNLTASGNLHPQEQKYIDTVVNRLKTLKNLVWCVNESADKTYPASYVARWKKIAQRIRSLDTYRHPIGIGLVAPTDPDRTPGAGIEQYASDPNIDQLLAQHYRADTPDEMYSKMVGLWNGASGRYSVMLAQGFGVANGADGRRKSWAAAMAGAYPMQTTTGPGKVWDVLQSPDADLDQLGYIDDFFKGIARLNFLVPRNDLKDGNTKWVLAEAGRTYVAYSPAATANLGVKGLTAGTYDLKWLDTIDGSTVVQRGVQVTTSSRTFARPSGIQAECALAIVRQ